MRRAKPPLMIWVGLLILPFATAFLLATGVRGEHGSSRLQPSIGTALANFGAVLKAGDTPYEFLSSFGTSAVICIVSSLITVACALPFARRLGTLWSRKLWTVAAVAIGARVVPVTAPLPIFADLVRRSHIPDSWLLVIMFYVLLCTPIACALLATAEWREISTGQKLLAMDAGLSRQEWIRYQYRSLGPDLGIAAAAVFLLCWSDFVIASFFLPPGDSTIARLLANKQGFLGTQWGRLGAGTILSLIPVGGTVALITSFLGARVKVQDEPTQ